MRKVQSYGRSIEAESNAKWCKVMQIVGGCSRRVDWRLPEHFQKLGPRTYVACGMRSGPFPNRLYAMAGKTDAHDCVCSTWCWCKACVIWHVLRRRTCQIGHSQRLWLITSGCDRRSELEVLTVVYPPPTLGGVSYVVSTWSLLKVSSFSSKCQKVSATVWTYQNWNILLGRL